MGTPTGTSAARIDDGETAFAWCGRSVRPGLQSGGSGLELLELFRELVLLGSKVVHGHAGLVGGRQSTLRGVRSCLGSTASGRGVPSHFPEHPQDEFLELPVVDLAFPICWSAASVPFAARLARA